MTESMSVMEPKNIYSLSTLMKRYSTSISFITFSRYITDDSNSPSLEAVTSGLEDIATFYESPESAALTNIERTQTTKLRPEAAPSPNILKNIITPLISEPVEKPLPSYTNAFDHFLHTVGRYVQLSHELGGPVERQAARVLVAFQEQQKLLVLSTKVDMRPYMHVDQYLDCAQYFGNKVMKEFKGK